MYGSVPVQCMTAGSSSLVEMAALQCCYKCMWVWLRVCGNECVCSAKSESVCVAPWREKEWNEIVWGREREKQLQLTSVRSESSSWQECSCRKINFLWKHQLFCLTRLKTPSKIGAKSSKIKRHYLHLTWASFSKLRFRASSCFFTSVSAFAHTLDQQTVKKVWLTAAATHEKAEIESERRAPKIDLSTVDLDFSSAGFLAPKDCFHFLSAKFSDPPRLPTTARSPQRHNTGKVSAVVVVRRWHYMREVSNWKNLSVGCLVLPPGPGRVEEEEEGGNKNEFLSLLKFGSGFFFLTCDTCCYLCRAAWTFATLKGFIYEK